MAAPKAVDDTPAYGTPALEQAHAESQFELLVACEALRHAHDALSDLLIAFHRELAGGYTTAAQQAALRNARTLLVRHREAAAAKAPQSEAGELVEGAGAK